MSQIEGEIKRERRCFIFNHAQEPELPVADSSQDLIITQRAKKSELVRDIGRFIKRHNVQNLKINIFTSYLDNRLDSLFLTDDNKLCGIEAFLFDLMSECETCQFQVVLVAQNFNTTDAAFEYNEQNYVYMKKLKQHAFKSCRLLCVYLDPAAAFANVYNELKDTGTDKIFQTLSKRFNNNILCIKKMTL